MIVSFPPPHTPHFFTEFYWILADNQLNFNVYFMGAHSMAGGLSLLGRKTNSTQINLFPKSSHNYKKCILSSIEWPRPLLCNSIG